MMAQKEMKEQFIRLQQKNWTVDEYVVEFMRLSRFAPYMVVDEEDQGEQILVRAEDENPDVSSTPAAQNVFSGSTIAHEVDGD